METSIPLPTIGIVLGSAAIDSINPCAIGVLILMISILMNNKKSTGRMILLAGLYIFAIFLTYLLAGLGLVYFLAKIPLTITEYISLGVGVFVIVAGLFEIKDYFFYQWGFSLAIPPSMAKKIHTMSTNISVPGVILTGMFVAGVELPCTGAPYLAITALLSLNFNFQAFILLVLYNVIFVMPLIIILILVLFGVKLSAVKAWKQESRGIMRLAIGLLLIGLGWLLILIANGTINLN